MTHDIEYSSYDDADGIATLENIRYAHSAPGAGRHRHPSGPTPQFSGISPGTAEFRAFTGDVPGAGFTASPPYGSEFPSGPQPTIGAADGRTEQLLDHGRQRPRRSRLAWLSAHWRAVLVFIAVAAMAFGILVLVLPGGGASWPASVAVVQTEITQACQNPNVAAEPSQLNFACAKDTQPVLWVFALLTSGDNPSFVDRTTGRKGLEPIQPTQGGDIAWSLNLHHPYNPANPIDSLQVAARAINNIISGATLTSSSGSPDVEPGLESTAANCQRYTGSAQLVSRPGYPARCASPIAVPYGQAALVSDIFQQWMGGTPSQIADEAGVLFENADNPGNSQVQAILASLPDASQ